MMIWPSRTVWLTGRTCGPSAPVHATLPSRTEDSSFIQSVGSSSTTRSQVDLIGELLRRVVSRDPQATPPCIFRITPHDDLHRRHFPTHLRAPTPTWRPGRDRNAGV